MVRSRSPSGGRLVVELNADEATELGNALKAVVG
jgi:hypothetical protein